MDYLKRKGTGRKRWVMPGAQFATLSEIKVKDYLRYESLLTVTSFNIRGNDGPLEVV